jgi:hypothetical protein
MQATPDGRRWTEPWKTSVTDSEYLLAGAVAGAKSCSYCETGSSSRRPWYVDARHQAALSGVRDTPRVMASHFYCMGPLICYGPYILKC